MSTVFFGSSAFAATFDYGSLPGTTVNFENISETPFKASDPFFSSKLFGDPTVVGDAITFNPASFSLTVAGGAADILDSQLNFVLQAKAGYGINGFGVQEQGDVSLFPEFSAAGTWAQVAAPVFLTITEIDGVSVNPITISGNVDFGVSGGIYNIVDNPNTTNWFGSKYFDIGAELAALSITGNATRIQVTLDNTLSATSQAGTIAKIQKKLFDGLGISVVTEPGNPIPEPSSIVLAAMGLVALGAYGRRRAVRA